MYRLALALLLTPLIAYAQNGILPTPGADTTKGFLETPGGQSPIQNPKGFLITPGYDQKGFLPTPGRDKQDKIKIGTQYDSPAQKNIVAGTKPNNTQNLGPYAQPKWTHTIQTLWGDTRPRNEKGELLTINTYSQSLPDVDLPNPNPDLENIEQYKPKHLYDRSYYQNQDIPVYSVGKKPKGQFIDNPKSNTNPLFPPQWITQQFPIDTPQKSIWGQPIVFDGDTLLLNGHHIRLYGIDAPEIEQLCRQNQLVRACGQESKNFLAQQIEHQTIFCRIHYRDISQRLISTCYTKDFNINAMLIQNGLALPWQNAQTPYDPLAQNAKENKNGLWATTFLHPNEWRQKKWAFEQQQHFNQRYDKAKSEPFPFVPFGQSPDNRKNPVFVPN